MRCVERDKQKAEGGSVGHRHNQRKWVGAVRGKVGDDGTNVSQAKGCDTGVIYIQTRNLRIFWGGAPSA